MRNGALGALAFWVLVGASARAADPGVNTIQKVSVKGGTVEIIGTRKPSFTTFPMTDPPRFVIDISEAVFAGVPEDVSVPSGSRITAVKTATYGSDASAIARVVIGFDREAEPDVQATGNTLVVKVGSGSAPAVAARSTPPPPTPSPAQDRAAIDQTRALAAAAPTSVATKSTSDA
ncbi:MAG: AMIN domain-containing protein, partial [Myxococcaceae bacterium]